MTTTRRVTLRVCLRCEHQWFPRKQGKPRACGRCKSSYWDRPPINKPRREKQD